MVQINKQLGSILGYILLFLVFLWGTEEGLLGHLKIHPVYYAFLLITVGCLLLYFTLQRLKKKKQEEFNELRKEFSFLTINLKVSVIISLCLSLIFIGISAVFNEMPKTKKEFNKLTNTTPPTIDTSTIYKNLDIVDNEEKNFMEDNIFDILGIVLSFISIFVIVRGLFDKILPITSIDKLLSKLAEDIYESSNREDCDFYMVYPALNIGHYRSMKYPESLPIYQRFTASIDQFLSHRHDSRKIRIVTFPQHLYATLYIKYCTMVAEQDNRIINECSEEAKRLFGSFQLMTSSIHRDLKCFEIDPNNFPQHFILIGNVVYLINTFGLPEYENGTFVDPFPDQTPNFQEKLAKLYVYRQEDKLLSELLKDKIKNLTDPTQQPNTP